jgi:hypothetical protein
VSLKIEREKRSVALFKPEDRRQMAELLEAINTAATEAGPKRIGDTDENSPVHLAAVAYDEFKAKALKRATKVGITALKGKAWRALLTEHLPRKDVLDDEGEVVESWPQDAQAGFNVDTMALPLVLLSIDADQFESTADLEEFVDDLSDPDFSRIYSEAVRVNTEAGPDPKWSASSWHELTSAVMSRSAETSD